LTPDGWRKLDRGLFESADRQWRIANGSLRSADEARGARAQALAMLRRKREAREGLTALNPERAVAVVV
jgi:hypothetical protein